VPNTEPVERRRRVQNRLLRSLASSEYRRLAPHLEPITLPRGQILHRTDDDVDHVYFPMHGICGVVAITGSGHGLDVGSIGCEGVTGVFMLTAATAAAQVVVQVGPVAALRLAIERFAEEMNRHGAFRQLVTSYYQAFLNEVVDSVSCNRLHSARERYCRRLLTIADRVGSESFAVTHGLMASILGIQRSAVSNMALQLKHQGIIDYRRGALTIVGRAELESSACACYGVSRARVAHLLPPPLPRPSQKSSTDAAAASGSNSSGAHLGAYRPVSPANTPEAATPTRRPHNKQ
jgi:CRP-like cAMP-binding protein